MIDNVLRHGNFTSSQAYRLCGKADANGDPPKAFYTYVEEKIFESRLKRSLQMGAYSRSMAWGKFHEKRVNDMLGLKYELISKITFVNDRLKNHSGSPDFIVRNEKIAELKCYEPKKFCAYVSALLTEDVAFIRDNFPAEYWQIVSNVMIHKVPKGEAIVYMPYAYEMEQIRELVEDPIYLEKAGVNPWEVRFISESSNSELAVLPDDSDFKNLNIFEFEVPVEDIIFLTKRLKLGSKLLKSV